MIDFTVKQCLVFVENSACQILSTRRTARARFLSHAVHCLMMTCPSLSVVGQSLVGDWGLCSILCWVRCTIHHHQNTIHHHHHHQSLNREGRWGTTDDFATSFLHFSLFSTALWDLVNSRPGHSLMLSSYLVLCRPCLLPPFTVPCTMVLTRWDT